MAIDFSFNVKFSDLYSVDGLQKIDQLFLDYIKNINSQLLIEHLNIRNNIKSISAKIFSNHIIELSPILEDFISELFAIRQENQKLVELIKPLSVVSQCKRLFIQRYVVKKYKDAEEINIVDVKNNLAEFITIDENIYKFELKFSKLALNLLDNKDEEKLDVISQFAAWALYTKDGKKQFRNSNLFKIPKKLDYYNLINFTLENNEIKLFDNSLKIREGFKLTDQGCDINYAIDQTHYCIFCHNQQKDSCSKGLKDKDNNFKKNEGSIYLTGCPLEEKISEMNTVFSEGYSIAALAIITIDNPMVAATGNRICNDCMKSCIYQKQEPVNIPQIETRILNNVLTLPYGFEIYSLLTRWNPLKCENVFPKEDSNYKILIVGQGPSGFTLAHYLLNQGHTVVAIDGLKIEPLSIPFEPIKDIKNLYEDLDTRIPQGFGGVSEYGITVRWNKNYLKIIRLILTRRKNYLLKGGVRFGSNLTYLQAKELGFDHIALCVGAGKPNLLNIPNSLVRGIRTSSDFLMNLQLTGASNLNSLANLQLRMPIIVVGGGLTAIDTATEALAYYPIQVEKFLQMYESVDNKELNFTEEESNIAREFINHAKALREERKKDNPNILRLLNSWGGVKVFYRKEITNSPAYRLNHEELELAMQEGIKIIDNIVIDEIKTDKYQHLCSVNALRIINNISQELSFSVKSLLIAAGTSPNVTLAKEFPSIFKVNGKYLQLKNINNQKVEVEEIAKPKENHFLHYIDKDCSISFFGDMHPSYKGNVVKAMASAKQGYPIIEQILNNKKCLLDKKNKEFLNSINYLLTAKVHKVIELTNNIVEIIIKAPLAAKNFEPGQFYKLQNFSTESKEINNKKLIMEGLALTGAWVNKKQGLISTIVLEMGGSSNFCRKLKTDEEIILMGPTGTKTEIEKNKKVLLIGGGLGNAVLFSIAKELKENGSKVIYFAGYKKLQDRFKEQEIEKAADIVIWCCDEGLLNKTREQDLSFKGNIIEAIKYYSTVYPDHLKSIDKVITIGSDKMMYAINNYINNEAKELLKKNCKAIASINSPMQCMMKEICGQCLQRHYDFQTNIESYVYSCVNQDQEMSLVDFNNLSQRLKQNSTQEKLVAHYLKKEILI